MNVLHANSGFHINIGPPRVCSMILEKWFISSVTAIGLHLFLAFFFFLVDCDYHEITFKFEFLFSV